MDVTHSIATPIGTFDLSSKTTIASIREESPERLLIVRVDQSVKIYRLEHGKQLRIEFAGDETLYRKVALEYQADEDIVLEIESTNPKNAVIIETEPSQGIDGSTLYVYWFPWIDDEPSPSNCYFSSVISGSALTSAFVFVDRNLNGSWEESELSTVISPSKDPVTLFSVPQVVGSVRLISDQPLLVFAHYANNDCGAYDDQVYEYGPSEPGLRFVVPLSEGLVYLVATQQDTIVNHTTGSSKLSAGQHIAVSAVAGDLITANKPIATTFVRMEKSTGDASAAVGLSPAETGGTDFWVPPRIDLQVQTQNDDRRLLLAYADGRIETRPMPAKAMRVTTSSPAALYWFMDMSARDPWSGSVRRFEELLAIAPIDRLGTEYVNAAYVLATADRTEVNIDDDSDGIWDRKVTLDDGEMFRNYTRNPRPHSALALNYLGHISATNPVLAWQIGTGNWDGTDEHLWGTELRALNFGRSDQ